MLKRQKKRIFPPVDFSFLDRVKLPPYSYTIIIPEDKIKIAAHRHPLLFFCIKNSLKKHSKLVSDGQADITDSTLKDKFGDRKKTLIINDYVLFKTNPDFLLIDKSLNYDDISKFINQCVKLKPLPRTFIRDEEIFNEYAEFCGKDQAAQIFSKTTKIRFNSLGFDDIFIWGEGVYQKVPTVTDGCCSPKLNAIDLYRPEEYLYLNNSSMVEKLEKLESSKTT